ncbi:Na+/proline symporter/signal transduction histidine kinase [Methylopila capsulata]|uniref:histidine kinase n=1 Tax=Methylopila capsulata TaxID=61654 RepID=A0A9W6MQK7_9HYPH|nr:PAS domain-containing hybrid sensor histidine kinase/response regulator [Methylopila capsulata]MBM7851300.1 Na+/proline symporter/signal transduction histidine kinase [Methylopila capsulata]GLK54358.1 histidine kinase [Methylopila capsulata]
MQGWIIVAVAAAYLALLLGVAAYGEARRPAWLAGRIRPHLYALGLGVYCTAWSFAGAVGLAASSGWTFFALTLGAVVAIGAFRPLVARVVRLAKANNITSIADLIGARYGKSQRVAGLVAVAAVIGATPYLALQLKAITLALGTALGRDLPVDPALAAALALAVFACLFGTRQVEATERHEGLMLAIATESVVKLGAFLAVGAFVVWSLFDGPTDLYSRASAAGVLTPFEHAPSAASFAALALLSFLGAFLLPRQFHVTVVEARNADETATAAWLFPFYAVAMSLFVAPIAAAGLTTFGAGRGVDPDAYVLALPLAADTPWVAVIALTGVLSAATAMVLVESVALAIMVSNDLVIPALLKGPETSRPDMSRRLLGFRRLAIVVILLGAYAAHRLAGAAQLASLGLLSLAAIAQLAPAFFGGLAWRRATARGAIAGLSVGLVTWAWTLALPALASHWPGSTAFLDDGPYGLSWLAPRSLFGAGMADPLAHGVFWSLLLNALAFVLVSLLRAPSQIESQQAEAFSDGGAPPAPAQAAGSFRPWRSRVTTSDLVQTVGRYLGADRADRAFAGFARGRGVPLEPKAEADVQTLRFAEHLLASAIGAASSRLVLSLLLSRRNVTTQDALRLLDDASAAMQSNRDVLQTALDNARQGITAIDGDMKLVAWNREFRELFDLPEQMIHAGVGLDDIFRFNAARGLYGPVHEEEFVADRIQRFVVRLETLRTRLQPSGRVIEIRSARMPDGGVVTTYTDITETVNAQQALELANENLERRVRERTRELTRLNQELARAKTVADEANISKTRFLAAASHDILQPLNAARLFATSLVERTTPEEDFGRLSRNVDASLDAVEEILSALLDISRLDTGAMKPELSVFRLDEITGQLGREFAPVAADKGLKLAVVPTSLAVRSDRRLLRRLLQNLVSNAIKYTPAGRVIVGVRRLPDSRIRVEVWDTGLGIASGQQQLVFREFKRLEQGAKVAPGLGLGLSIVERIARVLDHPLTLRSKPGMGSVFSIELPTSVALPAPKPAEGLVGARGAALVGLVVLAIDNEPAILDGMATLLSGWGCTALTAANQREAEALMRARKLTPDALLADYHLDEADGLEAIVNLRWKLGQPIPAILITADRSPGLREQAAEKDVQVLPKPIRPAALRALLAQLLAQRAAAAE